MKNKSLAKDYISRARKRLSAVQGVYNEKSWADVVRESQEVVELALKSLVRECNIEIPRLHDVSGILIEEKARFPKELHRELKNLAQISKSLRRDRELAYYGSEDLTPSEFYNQEDADLAFSQAKHVVSTVEPYIK